MPRRLAVAVLSAAAMAVAGCTGSSSPAPHASSTSGTPSPSPTPTLTAAQQLQQLAQAATRARFHAIYRVHRDKPGANATMRVDHRKDAVRLDITAGKTTATLISAPRSTFACSRSQGQRSCLRVAGKGQRVPVPFNLAPASIFTKDVGRLAAHPKKYDVTAAGTRKAKGDVPASTCFRVRATTGSKQERRPVTYCFSDKGVLVFAGYASGNLLRLTSQRLKLPPDAFQPYSSPTPVPH